MGRKTHNKPTETEFAHNWQRKFRASDRMPPWNYEDTSIDDERLSVKFADGGLLQSGDYCYVVHSAGDPFAIARIMEYIASNDADRSGYLEDQFSVRVNWLYRPNFVHKKAQNTRELFLTMHSDVIPLESLRSKVTVENRHDISDLALYIKNPNCFWFDRFWDRYIARLYDVVPSAQLTNVAPELAPILRTRYKYLVMEPQRANLLMDTPHFCAVCDLWCSDFDSVKCVHCEQYYHRGCATPPIANPIKGYSWYCGPCYAVHERNLEESRGPDLTMRRRRSPLSPPETLHQRQLKEAEKLAQEEQYEKELEKKYMLLRQRLIPECKQIEYEIAKCNTEITPQQQRQLKLWPFRYYGVNSTPRDIWDLDDPVYPRAISRVGSRNQAAVPEWPGQPVVYYRTIASDRRKRGPKSKSSHMKDVAIKYEPENLDISQQWVQEAPPGYIERGSDATSTLLWSPERTENSNVDAFLEKTRGYAGTIGIPASNCNFIDASLFIYMQNHGNEAAALREIGMLNKKTLKEPNFSAEEVQRFEEAISIHGNNLHDVYKHVATKSSADIVRFYYLWKKTDSGHRIWDTCPKRASRQVVPVINREFAESIADPTDPLLTYSHDVIKQVKKSVICNFCCTKTSREWRKAPNYVLDPQSDTIEALCSRCARLWYRYAVKWMDPEAVMQLKQSKTLTRSKLEPELIEDAEQILNEGMKFAERLKNANTDCSLSKKLKRPLSLFVDSLKRRKLSNEEEGDEEASNGEGCGVSESEDDQVIEKENSDSNGFESDDSTSSPIEKESMPPQAESLALSSATMGDVIKTESPSGQVSTTPSSGADAVERKFSQEEEDCTSSSDYDDNDIKSPICGYRQKSGDKGPVYYQPNYCVICHQYDPSMPQLNCQICCLCVHAQCYGFVDAVDPNKAWHCECCLNDKDHQADHIYQCDICPVKLPNYALWLSGDNTGVPDALKRTWDGKWAHVRCAVWTPKVLFEDPKTLQQVEIYNPCTSVCMICQTQGAVVRCKVCSNEFHAGCACAQGYSIGFMFTDDKDGPIKFNGKQGDLEPAIICNEHKDNLTSNELIPMSEIDGDQNMTALQLYVRSHKMIDHPEIKRTVRRSLARPPCPSDAVVTFPIDFIENNDTLEPLSFVEPAAHKCAICNVTSSGYWIRYRDGHTICCACHWSRQPGYSKPPLVDPNSILQKLDKIFDAAVPIPRKRSMRIQDLLS